MTTVKIGTRKFRIGATYAPSADAKWTAPAIFEGLKRHGMVWYNIGGLCKCTCSVANWLDWAGDEVTP